MNATTIKQTPKWELIRLGSSSIVYVRGSYDRNSKRYELQRYDDMNSFRYVKGITACQIGFDF